MLGRFGNEAKFIEHHACISDGSSCRVYYKLQFDVVYESKVSKHHSHLFLSITSQQHNNWLCAEWKDNHLF